MPKLFGSVLILGCLFSTFAGNQVSLALSGDVYAVTNTTKYNIGFTPAFHWKIRDNRELMIAVAVKFWGEKYRGSGGTEYSIKTTYTTLGGDLGYYWRLFMWRGLSIHFGPELYCNYGLTPVTTRTFGDDVEKIKHENYTIGSFGVCAPVHVDIFPWKHVGVRLTERLFRITGDVVLGDDMEGGEHAEAHAGIEPELIPSISVMVRF